MLAREKDLLVSAVCSFSAAMCLFCQISNFHDTILAVDSERPCQRNQDWVCWGIFRKLSRVPMPTNRLGAVEPGVEYAVRWAGLCRRCRQTAQTP